MSRPLLRPFLGLRTPLTRLIVPFTTPFCTTSRALNTTPHIIEPAPASSADLTPPAVGSNVSSPSLLGPLHPEYPQPELTRPNKTLFPPPTNIPKQPISESVRTLLPALAAQPGHYITVQIWGKGYLVTAGDKLRLPFLMKGAQPGDVLRLNRATLLGSRDYTLKGAPVIDERLFECRATVLGVDSEPIRVTTFKKQRSRRMRRIKSKHYFTNLRISELRIVDPATIDDA